MYMSRVSIEKLYELDNEVSQILEKIYTKRKELEKKIHESDYVNEFEAVCLEDTVNDLKDYEKDLIDQWISFSNFYCTHCDNIEKTDLLIITIKVRELEESIGNYQKKLKNL